MLFQIVPFPNSLWEGLYWKTTSPFGASILIMLWDQVVPRSWEQREAEHNPEPMSSCRKLAHTGYVQVLFFFSLPFLAFLLFWNLVTNHQKQLRAFWKDLTSESHPGSLCFGRLRRKHTALLCIRLCRSVIPFAQKVACIFWTQALSGPFWLLCECTASLKPNICVRETAFYIPIFQVMQPRLMR